MSAASAVSPPPPPKQTGSTIDPDDLYQTGQQLFDQLAPPEVKAEYEFPTKEQWDAFTVKLQRALEGDSLEELAAYAPQARAALTTLRTLGADDELADWLEQRLDEIEVAGQVQMPPPVPAPVPAIPSRPNPPASAPVVPPRPAPAPKGLPARGAVPYYDLWLARIRTRPAPARAPEVMPVLRRAFEAEGIPPGLAWLAEAESSLNPSARGPTGARGLFQLMPETAKRLGLATFLPDERTNPEKSAHAAARYLRELHEKFGDWPLSLAAYNAGEGRVSRALASRKGKDFASVADALPSETRMYVPKVCALIATRTGMPVNAL